jgi:hypothetical protein
MSNLTGEPSFNTKADVLDLIISFLMDHEKQMEQMLERLERVVETLTREHDIEQAPRQNYPIETQPHTFVLTITNPATLEDMKSLTIEWGGKPRSLTDTGSDTDMTVRKIEHSVGKI